jgi:hypothetical protein
MRKLTATDPKTGAFGTLATTALASQTEREIRGLIAGLFAIGISGVEPYLMRGNQATSGFELLVAAPGLHSWQRPQCRRAFTDIGRGAR